MESTTNVQAYLFLISILSGSIVGLFFDCFRILRKIFKTSDFVTYIEDILFWIITGLFLLFILLQFDSGEIRLYNVIGLFIGVSFYMILISKFVVKISVTIGTFIKKIFKKIFSPITFLVINIKNIIKKKKVLQKKQN